MNLDPFIKNKTLLFTVTSDGYKYFTWNLAVNMKELGCQPLCILCLDRESYDFFNRIAMIPSRLFVQEGPHFEHKTPALFGTTPFKKMNRMKLKALQELSQREDLETLIFLDSDIRLFQNPISFFEEALSESPLWFQCDEARAGVFTCSDDKACTNACTGVIAMRLTAESRLNLNRLFAIEKEWKDAITDQDYINKRLALVGLSYRTFSREKVPNGVFLSDNRYKEGYPILLHFNHVVGMDKKRMMKNKDCWFLQV